MRKFFTRQLKSGISEGSRFRLGVGLTGLALLFLSRAIRPKSEVIWRHKMKPGETLTIRLRPRPE